MTNAIQPSVFLALLKKRIVAGVRNRLSLLR